MMTPSVSSQFCSDEPLEQHQLLQQSETTTNSLKISQRGRFPRAICTCVASFPRVDVPARSTWRKSVGFGVTWCGNTNLKEEIKKHLTEPDNQIGFNWGVQTFHSFTSEVNVATKTTQLTDQTDLHNCTKLNQLVNLTKFFVYLNIANSNQFTKLNQLANLANQFTKLHHLNNYNLN